MSPCWASLTLFTYCVQTIPEGLLGMERKALYPQLRQRCQCNVFQLFLTSRWLQRNSLSLGMTNEECPCVCISLSCPQAKGKSAAPASPALLQMGWCSCRWVSASLLWVPACPGWAGVGQSWGAVTGLVASGSFSACRPQQDMSSLIERQAPQLACTVCSPQLQRAKAVCCAAGWLCCHPGSCHAGCRCSVCPLRGCTGDGV